MARLREHQTASSVRAGSTREHGELMTGRQPRHQYGVAVKTRTPHTRDALSFFALSELLTQKSCRLSPRNELLPTAAFGTWADRRPAPAIVFSMPLRAPASPTDSVAHSMTPARREAVAASGSWPAMAAAARPPRPKAPVYRGGIQATTGQCRLRIRCPSARAPLSVCGAARGAVRRLPARQIPF